MPIIRIDNLHVAGLIKDTPAHELPPEAFSDCNNVDVDDGVVQRVKGVTQALGIPGTDYSYAPYWFQPYPTPNEYYWLYAAYNGTNWRLFEQHAANTHNELQQSSSSVNFNSTDLDIGWNGGVLGGIAVFNNGRDTPYIVTDPATPTNAMQQLPWDATYHWGNVPAGAITANVIRPFKQFLIALDVTKGGTRYAQTVKWSNPAVPGSAPDTWDESDATASAGEVDLLEKQDNVVECLPLRDVNIIYKDNSTWVQQLVTTNEIFKFYRLFRSYGILSRRCVAEFEGKHFVVTLGDVIIHDGQNVQRPLDGTLVKWIFSKLGVNYARSFVAPDYANHKILFCFPTDYNQFPNMMLIWNWDTGAATIRDINGVTHLEPGVVGSIYPTNMPWEEFANPELFFAGDTWIEIPDYAMGLGADGRIEMIVESTDDTIARDLWSSDNRDDHFELQISPTEAVYTIAGISTAAAWGTSDEGERNKWVFTWNAAGTTFNVYKDGVLENNTLFTNVPASNGFNIGVNQTQNANFFKGYIREIRVYDAVTGGSVTHEWIVNDGSADGGSIQDTVGSADGILHLGSGFWRNSYIPTTYELTASNEITITFSDTLTDNGAAGGEFFARTIGKNGDARVGGSSIVVSGDQVVITFPAGTAVASDETYLSYEGSSLDVGANTVTRFCDKLVTT